MVDVENGSRYPGIFVINCRWTGPFQGREFLCFSTTTIYRDDGDSSDPEIKEGKMFQDHRAKLARLSWIYMKIYNDIRSYGPT